MTRQVQALTATWAGMDLDAPQDGVLVSSRLCDELLLGVVVHVSDLKFDVLGLDMVRGQLPRPGAFPHPILVKLGWEEGELEYPEPRPDVRVEDAVVLSSTSPSVDSAGRTRAATGGFEVKWWHDVTAVIRSTAVALLCKFVGDGVQMYGLVEGAYGTTLLRSGSQPWYSCLGLRG